ncbi:MAG: tetrahydromethanopterin S-methyltransferase subunit C [Methanomicrobiales archaeon]|jgi:tetrahydromethanopterin S-methyltransferase subunit C|nr:tetrahydromethanopterin S-methyltransferase subunit C [Methanomicrobiales archaeon]
MTVKIEASSGGMPHNTIMMYGLIVSVVCIYLTYLNQLTDTQWFAFFGGIGAIAALWWGSDTIKHLCSYGLGTGVPSAGMIAFGIGAIAMVFATKFDIATPIVAIIIAGIIGAIIGYIANSIVNMNIPVMVMSMCELAIVGALTMLGFSAMCAGSFGFNNLVVAAGSGEVIMAIIPELGVIVQSGGPLFGASVIGGSVLAVIFILGAMALQHPFNACLGPNESQDRTLMLAAEVGFLSMIAVAVMSYAFIDGLSATIALVVSLLGWYYTFTQYVALSKRDAFMWLDAKPIREVGGK